MTVSNKVAVVTGAGSGIGRAVALALQRNGWHVVLPAVALASSRRRRAGQLPMAGKCSWCRQTLPTPHRCRVSFKARSSASAGSIFCSTTPAYSAPPVPFEDLTLEQWTSVVDINLTGAFLCAQAAFRQMKAQTPMGGRIINNGSISATSPRPLSAPYTATKHAMTGLTKSLSLDGRAYNIACSQIDIGNAETELTAAMAKGVRQADGSVRSEPRMDVRHVADAVLYIAGLPLEANVQFMTLMATAMPFIGRG